MIVLERLYFDNAATTMLRPEALNAMMPYLTESFGNPSGLYTVARTAKKAMEEARRQVADTLNARPEEIFFTGSGTESDNWAIRGVAEAMAHKGKHIITSSIEHHAVLHTCKYLEKNGYAVTYLPVDEAGLVSPADVEAAIRPDTVLVSVMTANNEVGTVEPVAEIGAIARKHKIYFHTDAVQAGGHIPLDVAALNADLLTLSAHKFYGPRGVGVLYVKSGTPIKPLLHGGAQERNRRAGTENVAGIVGTGAALALAAAELSEENKRVTALRDKLIKGLQDRIPNTKLNGHPVKRLPGNVNMSFAFIEGESLLMLLDMQGCSASTGSACSSGSLDPSHVLISMGDPQDLANSALRFTLGRYTTEAHVDALIALLPPIVEKLRAMSPLYDDFLISQKNK
jgi:cysteine desulfurase